MKDTTNSLVNDANRFFRYLMPGLVFFIELFLLFFIADPDVPLDAELVARDHQHRVPGPQVVRQPHRGDREPVARQDDRPGEGLWRSRHWRCGGEVQRGERVRRVAAIAEGDVRRVERAPESPERSNDAWSRG